jgi:hypothetical protein
MLTKSFYAQPPRSPHSINQVFLSVWRPKTLECSFAIENEEKLHQRVLRPVRSLATTPVPMKSCYIPRSDVSVCAFIGVEDILSIPFFIYLLTIRKFVYIYFL